MPEPHDHSAPNDRQHVAQHVGEMYQHLVHVRALPVVLVYQGEDGEFGILSSMIESDTIGILEQTLGVVKGNFESVAQWELPPTLWPGPPGDGGA